jgi:hypothetical protein
MLKTPRGAVLLVFAAFGALVGANVGALPIILQNAGVDEKLFGFAQGANMSAGLVAMGAGSYVSRFFDHRTMMLVFLPLGLLGLVGTLVIETPMAFVATFVAFGALLSFLDLNMNAEGAMIEQESGRPVFTMYHACVSLSFAFMSIVSSYLSANFGPPVAAIVVAVIVVWAMLEVLRLVPKRRPQGDQGVAVETQPLPWRKLALVGLTIGLSNSCEITAMLWAGQLLSQLKPELIAYSGLGAAFFGVCGGIVRAVGDQLRTRFGEIPVMTIALAVATSGFFVLSLSPGFSISVLAFAAVGAGLAPIFPGLFAMAGGLAPKRRAAGMGLAATISGIPRVAIPVIIGLLAQSYGLKSVFFVAAVLAAFTLIMVAVILPTLADRSANARGASLN